MSKRLLSWCGLVLAVGTVGCPRPDRGGTEVAGGQAAFADSLERRECPKEWEWDSLRVMVPGNRLSGTGPVQNVPEFHDCQRFLVKNDSGDLVYDGIFAIFAEFNLRRLDTLVLIDTLPPDARGLRAELMAASGLTGREAVPAAEIWAPDTGYEPLLIEHGFDCLYLRRVKGRWEAVMVSSGMHEEDCSQATIPEPWEPNLEVHLSHIPGGLGLPNDFPEVARWDWDSVNQQHYIGIRCGAAWCEVGKPGFQPSKVFLDGLPNNESLPAKKRRAYGIKGWYDQQYLATIPSAGGGVVPTRILGTIIPDPDLGERGDADFKDQWVPGAEVALEVPSGAENPYYDKFYFAEARPGDGRLNTIELCHGQACPGLPEPTACEKDYDDWWARITRADDGAIKYRCVSRCDLSAESAAGGFSVPGTARWRWLAQDEKTWMRCSQGCCETR